MKPTSILVVEDEAVVAMNIEDRLAAMGYELAGSVPSGEEALTLVARQRPDLALMDIRLQGAMDGITAAEEIRSRFQLPVVFLTAFSEEATLERAKRAEPYGYILKPFDDRELKSVIEIAIYKHRAEAEILRLNRLYDVLSMVNQTVLRVSSPEELLPAVCRLVVERGAIDLAWIGRLDPVTSRIIPVAHFGTQSEILEDAEFFANGRPEGQGSQGKAIREGEPFVCNECVTADCLYPSSLAPARFGFQSCGSFPIRFQGRIWGVFSLCVRQAGFFRQREIELLREVAMDVSFALDMIEGEARRRRAEASLREREDFIRTILDHLPVGIAVNSVDPCVRFEYMNDNFARFYRTTREALANPDAFWEVVYEDPAFREEIKRRVLEDCASGDPERMFWEDVPITRKGEKTAFITARNIPLPEKHLVISTVWDVTERKSLESQLLQAQRMEAVGRLAGGVAHDYNNILGVIIGYAELALLKVDPADPLHADLKEIIAAATRSTNITRQLLAFARRQTIAPVALDLDRTVQGMLKMLRRLIGEDIDLAWLPKADPWLVKIDPAQVDQILANLCINARDAISGVGKITIETGKSTFDEAYCAEHLGFIPGEFVLLAVSDNGCGMDREILEHVFEPFFTTKGMGEGTGLGLSTVYGIVKQNNGFVNVYSEPGKGSTIRVYLPRLAGEAAEAIVPMTSEPPPSRGETILLVEDEQAFLKVSKTMLERLGYRVLAASTPGVALELAREHAGKIHLLITDVVMPEMNGRELSERLQSLYPQLKCLFISGYTANAIAHRGVLKEGVCFVQKPFSIQELATKVRKALG